MIEFTDKRSAADRAHAFIDAWNQMPMGGEMEFRLGRSEAGEAGILIYVNGTAHAFRTGEARVLVKVFDDTIKRFPAECASIGAPTLRQTIVTAIEMAEAQP